MTASTRAAAPSDGPRPASVRRWNASVLALVGLGYLVAGYRRRWISDDGLIVVRTVRQVLAGNGPTFNAGERVEANTSTLWTYLLVVLQPLTRLDPARLAVYAGLLLSVAGLLLAMEAARRVCARSAGSGRVLPLGALVVLAVPPFWDFATSGLETGLVFCWLGGAYLALVAGADAGGRRRGTAVAVLFGLAPLVRPELALVGAVLLVALWILRGRGGRDAVLLVGAAGSLPLAYQVFRMGYYGMLVPQTAISKEAGSSLWSRGAGYVADGTGPYVLWLPLVLVAVACALHVSGRPRGADVAATRVTALLVLAPVLSGLLLGLYVVRIGGDFMHGRMLLPPLFLLLLPVMVVPLRRLPMLLVAGTAVWASVCGASLRPHYADPVLPVSPKGIADERTYWTTAVKDTHPVTARPYLEAYASAEFLATGRNPTSGVLWAPPLVDEELLPIRDGLPWRYAEVLVNMGKGGELVRLDEAAIDPIGLTYPLAAHAALGKRGRPGHEKQLPYSYIVADLLPPGSALPADSATLADVLLARQALGCGEIAELQQAVRAPLTPSRFWKNITGAPQRTSFRIPLDPAAAVARFC